MANNIVEGVNENIMKATQQAILARILGGAKANPVMGGVNQAPTGDVANAIAETQQAPIPKLLGARVPQFDGGAGGSGFAAGLGNALTNMYNSRIAQSENEVAQAQAARQAENIAARQEATQMAIAQREEEKEARREEAKRNDPMYQINLESAQIRLAALKNAQATAGKEGGGGQGVSAMPAGVSRKAVNDLITRANEYNPATKQVVFNRTLIEDEAARGNPNAVHIIRSMQDEEIKAEEKNQKTYDYYEAKRDQAEKAGDVEKAIEFADRRNEVALKLKKRKPVVQPNSAVMPQPQVKNPASVLDKAAMAGAAKRAAQQPVANPVVAPETFVNPQPELLY